MIGAVTDQPAAPPRLLMIMGSGETSPTMVTPHQRLFARLGRDVPAVLLDTPYGFQENADELTERIRGYFRESVGREVGVARLRSRADAVADPALEARSMLALEQASWVFAGPGSPTYALAQWSGTRVVDLLDERLRAGGAVVFASAAALTLGALTVPVYEVYKVGAEPTWLAGLDVLGRATGLRAAVVPHFDNAEGGTHDTRFCYLGERRLRILLDQLPTDAFVLGVDEHTGLLLDLDTGAGEVVGRGGVTVVTPTTRTRLEPGDAISLDRIAELAGGAPDRAAHTPAADPPTAGADALALLEEGRVQEAADTILALHAAEGGSERVRTLVAALGDRAANAPVDTAALVGPFVELLLELRASARTDKRFAESDQIRDGLAALGVEVRDTPAGAEWQIA